MDDAKTGNVTAVSVLGLVLVGMMPDQLEKLVDLGILLGEKAG